jgi:hypothetical protein
MEESHRSEVNEKRVEFWNNSRIRMNKLLAANGVLLIVLCAFIFAFVLPPTGEIPIIGLYFFLYATSIYIVYIGVINFLFLLIEILDRTLVKIDDLRKKNILFSVYLRISLGVPFLYPLLLLTMYYLDK